MTRNPGDISLPVADSVTGTPRPGEGITLHSGPDAFDRVATLAGDSNLTMSQLLIWMGQKLDPHSPLYNMALTFELKGPIDPEAFATAFDELVTRCDAMRLIIDETSHTPQAVILPVPPVPLHILDLSNEPDPSAALERWSQSRCEKPFDLTGCLCDSSLIRVGVDHYVWYLNQHHLITDGGSKNATYRHMSTLYRLALDDRLDQAPEFPTFSTYAAYEKTQRESTSFEKSRAYWRQKADPPPPDTPDTPDAPDTPFTPIRFYGRNPGAKNPGEEVTSRTHRVYRELGIDRTTRLNDRARSKEIRSLSLDMTRYDIFLTLLFAYLHRIDGRRDLCIGTPFHHRLKATHKDTPGLFMEVFPSRVRIEDGETFLTLLKKVRFESHGALRHAKPGAGNMRMHHTYGVVLNYINASFPSFNDIPVRCTWLHPNHGDTRHRLRLQVHDFDDVGNLMLHFDLNEDVFTPQARGWVVDHFLNLLDAFLDNPDQPIDAVDLLSEQERHEVIHAFNDTDTDYPRDQTVVQIYESIVTRFPHETAVDCDGTRLSYEELDRRANRLAEGLHQHGVRPGQVVGVCANRSTGLIVALLGVLKAGGGYVPIDPSLPRERVAYMLEDSGASVVLIHSGSRKQIPDSCQAIVIELDNHGVILSGDIDRSPSDLTPPPTLTHASPEDLAYVIYTSGSTGQPKGVMVEHRNLINYLSWAKREYVDESTHSGRPAGYPGVAFYTSFSFDLTVTSIFLPLICGGSVVIYPEDKSEGTGESGGGGGGDLSFLDVVEDDKVDILKATPAHLAMLVDDKHRMTRLRKLIVGGEDLKTRLANSIAKTLGPHIEIYNEYGPTEATVGCMIHRFDPATDTGVSVPIGVPSHNAQIYLLDRNLNPVPTGIEGELYIGGDPVTRGYMNQPGLTEQKFIPDPFRPGRRLYRTSDTARRNERGLLEFIGRIDSQVKILGVRIELGEVESALGSHPDIKECVVIPIDKPTGDRASRDDVTYCKRCGLASNHPEARMNHEGVCALCTALDTYRDKADQYFKTQDDLRTVLDRAKAASTEGAVGSGGSGKSGGGHDCLMLYSGGKDSTYALYRVAEMGLRVLVFTLDNGYISDEAKTNIQRVVDDLGLELVVGRTPAMNKIFVDSLQRYSNVCQGCFKTIYTLSMNLARERGIRHIVTGLSRGQFFETRVAEIFRSQIFDSDEIDRNIIEARKAYHRMDDAVSRNLDVSMFEDDDVFERIEFIDFYRYCDVELDEMLAFLDKRAPWIRPSDTGRSTNCLINEAGIYVHKKTRGFHNYALPYSWDVRLGHKQRDEALDELNDEIDPRRVNQILSEIGYAPPEVTPGTPGIPGPESSDKRLAAYYVATRPVSASQLREYLADKIPGYMTPSYFTAIEQIPLAPSGKLDRTALPQPGKDTAGSEQTYVAARTPIEVQLTEIWSNALGLEKVGVHDNFFDLGGDSIVNIQIVAKAGRIGLSLTPIQLFQNPTIAQLSQIIEITAEAKTGSGTGSTDGSPQENGRFSLANLDDQQMSDLAKKLDQIDGIGD